MTIFRSESDKQPPPVIANPSTSTNPTETNSSPGDKVVDVKQVEKREGRDESMRDVAAESEVDMDTNDDETMLDEKEMTDDVSDKVEVATTSPAPSRLPPQVQELFLNVSMESDFVKKVEHRLMVNVKSVSWEYI